MRVLVPDDPVFFAKFQSLEQPLLRHLHRLHSEGGDSDDERIVSDAYDSWVRVLLKLPLWHSDDVSADSAVPEWRRCALYSARGEQLTSLCPIDLNAADLGQLAACLALFADGERAWGAIPGQAQAEPADREEHLTDAFRRVMEVLSLSPPQGLLGSLRHAVLRGPVVRVTLSPEQEREYRCFCQEIVTILSSGDAFALRSHRAMYL
ncbi:hypothetical protein BN159_0231 [Streptomyces davaonensis JCM 4913]|uniref:Uncharacterized protein n=1 Tax=Streptomyces davaonensis (strain DSM 101723 / JCM 4913 / KCC S-0913 / 768) TaxID=1214101 RepID=K4QUX7_STRDJ|nr:hypothetical protein [Streptomyces davaonensis]CCK24610.1 hypothetical protein BN159_0231 [Streptomyces davaonensis JCM 4913]